MTKIKIWGFPLFLFAVVLGSYLLKKTNQSDNLPTVAIAQIIDHNTLDVVRQGLLDGLSQRGYVDGKTIKILYENAHGNVTVSAQIAKKFSTENPKVMVGLSTQSAQMLQPYIISGQTSLVFSAVTDPTSARLVSSWKETQFGITGVSDYMDPEPQLRMIKAVLPFLTKLGILYNPAEINSVSFLESFEKTAKEMGVEIVRSALNTTSEAASAAISLIGKVDALYFPNDNTAMAAVGAIVTVGMKNKLPVFANDLASVEQGALAAVAYDRHKMGMKTADIVIGLLEGKSTDYFPVTNDISTEVVVNSESFKQLNLSLPAEMLVRDVKKSSHS